MLTAVDTSLIERLARLKGVGEAYHDYRGDLRYFTLKTRIDILRAMGSAVLDDPAALAAEFRPSRGLAMARARSAAR